MTRKDTFQQRRETFAQAEEAARNRHNKLAVGRLVWFVAAVAAVWLSVNVSQTLPAIIAGLVGIAGFLYLLKRHQTIRRERDYAHHLVFINQDEAARLDRKFLRPETGHNFIDPAHPYTGDLDVFGNHSLFRLLNRTHTNQGTHRLADWLRYPADAPTIRSRQQAVSELAPLTDWRQQVEAIAYLNPNVGESPAELLAWATEAAVPIPGYLHIVRWVLPAITITLFGCWLAGLVPGLAVIGALVVHSLVLSRVSARVKGLTEKTHKMARALNTYHALFAHIESTSFQAAPLQGIQRQLTSGPQLAGPQTASAVIARLSRLTENLSFRQNPYFVLFFGLATLWDIHYLIGLENWQQQHGRQLAGWFNALGELEALNSLAGLAFAQPDYTVPVIYEAGIHLEAVETAHPMLVPGKAVANSLVLAGAGQTVLITGSNMSGKSTFLRTLGANVVLALAGSVVSGERFSCSPIQLFTSMRTLDSLEESTSSFYAELKRLQTLIRMTGETDRLPVLYFLDEILKGTNSADRHRGAEALIRQLHRTTASGFVSTHDLELGQLGNDEDFVRNYHFQSDIRNGELLFDYRLRDGICKSFNASQLMRAIGIDIQPA